MIDLASKDAYDYAYKKHEGQTRAQGTPYIDHCVNVYKIVSKINLPNFNKQVAQKIALLHDTIEDTAATYDEIKKLFGKDVADGVLALTKDEKLPTEQQMADSLKRIKECGLEASVVKIADRIDNISQINPLWTKERAIEYAREAELIANTLGDVCSEFKKVLEEKISNYLKMIK